MSMLPPITAAFADYFGLGCMSPLIPFWVESHNGNPSAIGAILTAQYSGVIIGSTCAGLFSDRLGRKKTLTFALLGDVVFFTLTAFVGSINAMIAVRFLAGLFTPLTASIAWILDISGDDAVKARNQGFFGMASVAGFMLGAAMGGFFGYKHFKLVNIFCGSLAAFACLNVVKGEEPDPPFALSEPHGRWRIVRTTLFCSLAMCNFVVGLQFTGITTISAIILPSRFEYKEWQLALAYMGITFGHFVCLANLKRLVSKFGKINLMFMSFLLSTLSQIILCFEQSYAHHLLTLGLLTLSSLVLPLGMTIVNLLSVGVADKFGKNARGATVGFLRTIFNIGQALGPVYAVFLIEFRGFNGFQMLKGGWFYVCQALLMLLSLVFLKSAWGTNDEVNQRNRLPGNEGGEGEMQLAAMGIDNEITDRMA